MYFWCSCLPESDSGKMSDLNMSEKTIDRHAPHKENGSEEFKETEHILEVDPKAEDRILRKCDCGEPVHCSTRLRS